MHRDAPDTLLIQKPDKAGYPVRPDTGYPAGFSVQNLNVFYNSII
jgi:hypothetical protein